MSDINTEIREYIESSKKEVSVLVYPKRDQYQSLRFENIGAFSGESPLEPLKDLLELPGVKELNSPENSTYFAVQVELSKIQLEKVLYFASGLLTEEGYNLFSYKMKED